jgi:hypothetical protein
VRFGIDFLGNLKLGTKVNDVKHYLFKRPVHAEKIIQNI